MIAIPFAIIILAAAAWLSTIPTVCVPVAVSDKGQEIIACFEKVN